MNNRSATYDAVSTDFLVLIGRIVIGWSRIERAMDIVIAAAHEKPRKALKPKIELMKALCKRLPELMPHETWIVDRLNDIGELSECRHTIIHGYFHGVSDEDEPQINFRRAERPGDAGHRVIATRAELESFIQKVRKADEDMMFVMLTACGRKIPASVHGPRG